MFYINILQKNFPLCLAGLLGLLVAPKPALSWTVSTANKHGDKFGKYYTLPVNKQVERTDDDKDKMKNLTINPDYFKESNVDFQCPGYSVLTGIVSKYKYFNTDADNRNYSSDRNFAFICSFLEDPQDQPIQKFNCQEGKTPADNEEQKQGQSACNSETQFIHGLVSEKYRADPKTGEPSFFRDRIYKSQCCELRDQDGTPVKSSGECNSYEFDAGSNFTLECAEGYLLKKIESNYSGDKWDRSYKFECCKAGT